MEIKKIEGICMISNIIDADVPEISNININDNFDEEGYFSHILSLYNLIRTSKTLKDIQIFSYKSINTVIEINYF